MPFLVDTDVISATLRPRPNLAVQRRFAEASPDEQFMSSITYGELLYGALRRGSETLVRRIRQLAEQMPVLPFDQLAAERFADLRRSLERAGTPLDEPDLRIAATALVNGLTLVTGNERHFRRLPGLTVENWLVGESP